MKFADYVRVAKRRQRLLVAIPALATLAAVLYALLSPLTYTAVATVSTSTLVGAPWSQYTGPQGVNQFTAEFKATADSPRVLMAASPLVGVSVGDLKSGISVAQVGASSNMTLTYSGTSADSVAAAVREVTAQALQAMFQPQVKIADSQAQDAQDAVGQVNQDIAKLGAQTGTPDPVSSYQAALQQLSFFQQQQAQLRANGQFARADALSSAVEDTQKKLRSFAPILQKYNTLLAEQSAAVASLSTAREDFRRATAGAAAASSDTVFSISQPHSNSRVASALQIGIPVLLASLLLAVLIVFMVEVFARRGSAPRQVPTGVHA
jgi:capsular polysaccharide biosynthesis protein